MRGARPRSGQGGAQARVASCAIARGTRRRDFAGFGGARPRIGQAGAQAGVQGAQKGGGGREHVQGSEAKKILILAGPSTYCVLQCIHDMEDGWSVCFVQRHVLMRACKGKGACACVFRVELGANPLSPFLLDSLGRASKSALRQPAGHELIRRFVFLY